MKCIRVPVKSDQRLLECPARVGVDEVLKSTAGLQNRCGLFSAEREQDAAGGRYEFIAVMEC